MEKTVEMADYLPLWRSGWCVPAVPVDSGSFVGVGKCHWHCCGQHCADGLSVSYGSDVPGIYII